MHNNFANLFAETSVQLILLHRTGLVVAVAVGLLAKFGVNTWTTKVKLSRSFSSDSKAPFYSTFVDLVRPMWSWNRKALYCFFSSWAGTLCFPMVIALWAYLLISRQQNTAVCGWIFGASIFLSLVFLLTSLLVRPREHEETIDKWCRAIQ